jgi:hypothetical protein
VWCWHIFTGKTASKLQLSTSWLMVVAATVSMQILFVVNG